MRLSWLSLALAAVCACGRIGFDERNAERPIDGSIPEPSQSATLLVGVEGESASFVYKLGLEVSALDTVGAPQVSLAGVEALRLGLQGTELRGLSWDPRRDRLVAGSGSRSQLSIIGIAPFEEDRLATIIGSLGNAHGICALPNGNLIVGEYTESAGSQILELEEQGQDFETIATVYATQVTGGTLTTCHALSNDELILADENALDDSDGEIVRLRRSVDTGNAWESVDTLDHSAFEQASFGDHRTAVFAFALTDDHFYAFPIRRNTTQIPNLLRCARQDFDDCKLLVELPEDDSDVGNGPGTIMGATTLEPFGLIAFATNTALYVYDISSDSYEQLLRFEELGKLELEDGSFDRVRNVRHLVARP